MKELRILCGFFVVAFVSYFFFSALVHFGQACQ